MSLETGRTRFLSRMGEVAMFETNPGLVHLNHVEKSPNPETRSGTEACTGFNEAEPNATGVIPTLGGSLENLRLLYQGVRTPRATRLWAENAGVVS